MKKLLISILPLIVMLAFTGCSESSSADSSQNREEKVTLRIAWWGEQPRHDYTVKVIKLFEEKNPDIHIEFEFSNWDDYWKRLAPMAAANQLPDIMQMDLLYLKAYSKNKLLEDLTPYIRNNIIHTTYIDDKILSGGKVGEQLYGFPLGLNAPAVIMDSNLIASATNQVPKLNWTWNDFEKIAENVHKQKNIYGTNGMKPPEVFFPYYLRTNGKNLYNVEGTSLGYEDDKLFVDYFDMQLRLLNEGAFPRVDVTEQIKGIEDELLVNQQSPMTWGYSNQYYSFSKAADHSLEIIAPPGPNQQESLSVRPSMLFSITKSSKHKEAAARFINFFVNNTEANKLIIGERGVPVSSKVAENVKKGLSTEHKKSFDYVINVENSNAKVEKADPLGGIEVVNLLQEISEQILFKKITPLEGAQRFRKEANEILKNTK
ncbi:ABC transporter substrate-binding protein [Bacillus sp. USDA818B3_A]|uniref:ABC transporter substrate-binding protein n=1 Tax=Bacillus sp. USDA818B3_A TaxID=2698834 RepID=UPI00137218BE|nr:extracellular solute-binding protein [Bacillus sp. USDA818B3_A]